MLPWVWVPVPPQLDEHAATLLLDGVISHKKVMAELRNSGKSVVRTELFRDVTHFVDPDGATRLRPAVSSIHSFVPIDFEAYDPMTRIIVPNLPGGDHGGGCGDHIVGKGKEGSISRLSSKPANTLYYSSLS